MAGFFFCLASAECAGLLFLTCCNTAPYKRLQRVFCFLCTSYTTHAVKQRTWLYSGFSWDLLNSTAVYTRPTHADITPPAPRWSVSQRPDALQRIPDTTVTPGRCTGQHSRRPCQNGGVFFHFVRIVGKRCTRRTC